MSKKEQKDDFTEGLVPEQTDADIYAEILANHPELGHSIPDYYSPVSEPAVALKLEKGEFIFAKYMEAIELENKQGKPFKLHMFREAATGCVYSIGGYSANEQLKDATSGTWYKVQFNGTKPIKTGNEMKLWGIYPITGPAVDDLEKMLLNVKKK